MQWAGKSEHWVLAALVKGRLTRAAVIASQPCVEGPPPVEQGVVEGQQRVGPVQAPQLPVIACSTWPRWHTNNCSCDSCLKGSSVPYKHPR